MKHRWMRTLFVIAGIYDGVLGLAFVFFPGRLFELAGVPPPNHIGYVQFPALLLIVFAVLFFRVAADPVGNRALILYGCGLKLSYCATVFGHELADGIPHIWLPFAWADIAFLILFFVAWKRLGETSAAGAAPSS